MNLQHTAPDDVVARLRHADRRRLGGACAGLAVAVLVLALLQVLGLVAGVVALGRRRA